MQLSWNQLPAAAALCGLMAACVGQQALADDLFADGKPRDIKDGALIVPDTTIGGYALFPADNNWQMQAMEVSNTNSMGVRYGTAQLYRPLDRKYFADMIVTVNLNQSSRGFFLANDYCSGPHLVKVDKVVTSVGEGSWDNCLTIDPTVLTIAGKPVNAVVINIRNAQSGSRLYHLRLRFDPTVLGVTQPLPKSLDDKAFVENPALRVFVDRLTAWARQLQDATNVAVRYSKPADAFATMPSWWDLRSENAPALPKGALPDAPAVAAASAAAPFAMARSGPGILGTWLLKDRYGMTSRMDVTALAGQTGDTVYSTGDSIDASGRVLQARIGDAVLRLDSGSLWTFPLREGSSGTANVTRTNVDYPSIGLVQWRVVSVAARLARMEASVSYGFRMGAGTSVGITRGNWNATYIEGQYLPHSFSSDIMASAGSDARGHNENRVKGELAPP